MLSFEQARELVGDKLDTRLIAVDGLPCSGKSTLAVLLGQSFGLEAIYLDDFVLPQSEWPSSHPAFPFEYIRYDYFVQAVKTLAAAGECSYFPFDWNTETTSSIARIVKVRTPVII